ncbi:hypothetical protein FI667_g14706, partial [Globisporangium splendens]
MLPVCDSLVAAAVLERDDKADEHDRDGTGDHRPRERRQRRTLGVRLAALRRLRCRRRRALRRGGDGGRFVVSAVGGRVGHRFRQRAARSRRLHVLRLEKPLRAACRRQQETQHHHERH